MIKSFTLWFYLMRLQVFTTVRLKLILLKPKQYSFDMRKTIILPWKDYVERHIQRQHFLHVLEGKKEIEVM